MIQWNNKEFHCPVEVSMNMLSGKWNCLMLWHLNEGTKRYKELERIVPAVSQKMLTQQLKEMKRDGLVVRIVYPEVPPRVEYCLTELGCSAFPILEMMHSWAVSQLGVDNPEEHQD
ncbi:helix-turn-helix domain-containing protein [Desulfopila sp. IMCC35008]|uniref:winged helix-turn-helix transcriptional regulator n=1 Tax=Desulfopila sp. IMCC35008 TaxID=2653858 RepID=UPI0013D121BE|nr:helix-turn-helix domain-containing protein [Desulfopila sp. IMCC35008]